MSRSDQSPTPRINSLRRLAYISFAASAVCIMVACGRTPSHVIGPDDMAEVMADMYIAESVVDMNRHLYSTDSSRRMLKQSVLAKHGYTIDDFDTSMVWYGHHYSDYIAVYDNTIKILEERGSQAGSALIEANASYYGDSVDIWSGSSFLKINRRLPSKYVKFEIECDENSEPGDIYTWRAKLVDDMARSVRWFMLASYSDSTCEYLNSSTSSMGWNEMSLVTDSTRTLTDISGYFEIVLDREMDMNKINDIWIDSISLVRKRMNPDIYETNRYRLRRGHRLE
ncbi:MAG: DUF4296 domain-containing protein [Muribaculaceae bacterium]|nr:DUF4296 domain-containing protein [Muribaculaceae bacterium]